MKLAVIAGDGIGPEVIGEAVKVLDSVLPGVEKTDYDLGARRYHATGEVLPESVLEELRGHDAILLGAIGDPSVPSGVLERGLLLKTRFALDHHINLRPARLYPGVASPLAAQSAHRLRRRPRGHGGPVHRHRRCDPGRHSARGRHRGEHQHRIRRAQGGAGRVPPGRAPSQASDAGAQEQRADVRRRSVVAHCPRDRPGVPGGRGRLSARRRGDDPPRHRPRPLRRDRHRQPVRRHHHRLGGRGVRRYRAGRQRQHRRHPCRTRRCSNRCTAVPPTSPARAWRTRPRR